MCEVFLRCMDCSASDCPSEKRFLVEGDMSGCSRIVDEITYVNYVNSNEEEWPFRNDTNCCEMYCKAVSAEQVVLEYDICKIINKNGKQIKKRY